jgi:hypothetical protein
MFDPKDFWSKLRFEADNEGAGGAGQDLPGKETKTDDTAGGDKPPAGEETATKGVLDGKAGETDDTTDGSKASEQKDGEGEDKKSDTTDEDAVPEGDYTLTLPEGMELDTEFLTKATPVLKEIGLGNAKAAKLATLYAEVKAQEAEAVAQQWVERIQKHEEAARADPEYGGAAFDTNAKMANVAISKFATPEFVAMLREHGVQSHPEMIRMLYRVAKATADDTFQHKSETTEDAVPAEQRWYSKTTPASR